MSREYITEDMVLSYEETSDGITICGYRGREGVLHIPENIDGKNVTRIGKKAFLGQKRLREIYLPKTIQSLEEWAFGYCEALRELHLYPEEISLGKGVFLGCVKLSGIFLEEDLEDNTKENSVRKEHGKDLAGLLASTVTVLDAPYLFDPKEVGSREWMEKYDTRVLTLLHQDNMEGYAETILCGEEDYGNNNMERFRMEKRMGKVRMLFARLLNDYGLSEVRRTECEDYLVRHMPPNRHEETWQVVIKEHAEELPFYELLGRIGCITAENMERLLADLGGRQPEMKAYLMRYQEEHFKKQDFFAEFEL